MGGYRNYWSHHESQVNLMEGYRCCVLSLGLCACSGFAVTEVPARVLFGSGSGLASRQLSSVALAHWDCLHQQIWSC